MKTEDAFVWSFFKSLAFQIDAERAHEMAMWGLIRYGNFGSATIQPSHVARSHGRLEKICFGVRFPNPLGLAAGFDKNASCLAAWQKLGFGFVEVGTVTAKPQPGNEKPRLFRLEKDQALFNRLGFNNLGAHAIAKRMEQQKSKGRIEIPIGINIGKSKITPIEDAASDYLESFQVLADLADYIVVNVSSPNTPGLRDLQNEERFRELIETLANSNEKRRSKKPILIKLAPDLSLEGIRSCAEVARQTKMAGLVLTNTSIDRSLCEHIPEGGGGLSGAPIFEKSTEILRQLHKEYQGKLSLIGVGGVTSEETARAKLNAGADLIQCYTGFVYGGPLFPRRILRALLQQSHQEFDLKQ